MIYSRTDGQYDQRRAAPGETAKSATNLAFRFVTVTLLLRRLDPCTVFVNADEIASCASQTFPQSLPVFCASWRATLRPPDRVAESASTHNIDVSRPRRVLPDMTAAQPVSNPIGAGKGSIWTD